MDQAKAPQLAPAAPSPWLTELTQDDQSPIAQNLPSEGDIVIIGAGMTGCALAYHLHQLGRSCVVLDARAVSGGASGRNGGICWPDADEGFEVRTAEGLKAFIKAGGCDCAFVQNGGVELVEATSAQTAENLQKGSVVVNPVELLNAAPGIFKYGVLEPLAASFWPAKVVRSLSRAAFSAVFVEDCHAQWLEDCSDKSRVILHTTKGNISCSRIVVATNGWIPHLLPELREHFETRTNTVLCTADPISADLRWPISAMSSGGDGASEVYLNMRDDGRIVLGGLRDVGRASWGSDGDSHSGEDVIVDALQAWFARCFPRHSASVSFEHTWVGVLGFPKDNMPIIGEMPGRSKRVFVIGGFCGHGMPRCFGFAAALAQHLCGHPVEEAEMMKRCDVARFFSSNL